MYLAHLIHSGNDHEVASCAEPLGLPKIHHVLSCLVSTQTVQTLIVTALWGLSSGSLSATFSRGPCAELVFIFLLNVCSTHHVVSLSSFSMPCEVTPAC